jgi:serine/threonine protein phosphatase PrpC
VNALDSAGHSALYYAIQTAQSSHSQASAKNSLRFFYDNLEIAPDFEVGSDVLQLLGISADEVATNTIHESGKLNKDFLFTKINAHFDRKIVPDTTKGKKVRFSTPTLEEGEGLSRGLSRDVHVAKATFDAPGSKLGVTTDTAAKKLVFTGENMLKVAERLSGQKITATSSLGKTLLKLPTLAQITEDKENNTASNDVLTRFEKFYKDHFAKKEVGIEVIDSAKKEAAFLRFIIREYAERTAAKKIESSQGISLDEWQEVCQDLLGDTGTNISIVGVLGKRLHPLYPDDVTQTKYGALAGGLGDKITKAEFDKALELLRQSPDEKTREALTELLIGADNAKLEDDKWRFLDRTKKEDRLQIDANTITREGFEELCEAIALQYAFCQEKGSEKSFVQMMQEALGLEELSPQARAILTEQQKIIDENKDKKEYGGVDGVYKKKVEPLFAKFLKSTPEGVKLQGEVYNSILQNPHGCTVDDTTFPKTCLDNAKKYPKSINQGRPVFFPKATSYVVDVNAGMSLNSLCKYVAGLDSTQFPRDKIAEFKGLVSYNSPEDQLVDMLSKLSDDKFGYSHEFFSQAQAAARAVTASKGFSASRFSDNDKVMGKIYPVEIVKKLKGLVRVGIVDLASGKKLESGKDVAEVLFGEALAKALLPDLYKVHKAEAAPTPATEAEKQAAANFAAMKSSDAIGFESPAPLKRTYTYSIEEAIIRAVEIVESKGYKKQKVTHPFYDKKNLKQFFAYIASFDEPALLPDAKRLEEIKNKALGIDEKPADRDGQRLYKARKKLFTDANFFAVFAVELEKLEAQSQQAERVEFLQESRLVKSVEGLSTESPLRTEHGTSHLGLDIKVVNSADRFVSETQGSRMEQEDSVVTFKTALSGSEVVPQLLKRFAKVHDKAKKKPGQGSTAIVTHYSPTEKEITVVSCGDARAVLFIKSPDGKVKPYALTRDHDTDHPLDLAMLRRKGGEVSGDRYVGVKKGDEVIEESVNMLRGIGDFPKRKKVPYLGNPQPSVCPYKLSEFKAPEGSEFFLVTACDGLYSGLTETHHAEALEIFFANPDLRARYSNNPAEFLQDFAKRSKSGDNITVTVNHLSSKSKGPENEVEGIFDGHGGAEISAMLAESCTELAIGKQPQFMHKATDTVLHRYDLRGKVAAQILLISKAEESSAAILGLGEKRKPRDIVKAYKELLGLIDAAGKPKGNATDSLSLKAKKVLQDAFLDQFLKSASTSSALEILGSGVMKEYDHDSQMGQERGILLPDLKLESDILVHDQYEKIQRLQYVIDRACNITGVGLLYHELVVTDPKAIVLEGVRGELVIIDPKSTALEVVQAIDSYVTQLGDFTKATADGTPLLIFLSQHTNASSLHDFFKKVHQRDKADRKYFDIDAKDREGKTALLRAVQACDINKVAFLLAFNANPNVTFQSGDETISLFDLIKNKVLRQSSSAKTTFDIVEGDSGVLRNILELLIQGGIKYDDKEAAQKIFTGNQLTTTAQALNEVIARSNNYIIPKGLSPDEIANITARQVLDRKAANDRLSYGDRKPARVVGVATDSKVNFIPDSDIPFKVVLSYQNVLKALDKGKSDEVLAAKKVLAGEFLAQFLRARSNDRDDTLPGAQPGNAKEAAAQLVAQYLDFAVTIDHAYALKGEAVETGYAKGLEAKTAAGNIQSLSKGFTKQMQGDVYEIKDLAAVMQEVEKIRTAFAQHAKLREEKTFYKIFERLSPDTKYTIKAADFADLVKAIPETDEYKKSRQALAHAFVAQFKGKDKNEICQTALYDLTVEELTLVKQGLSFDPKSAESLGADLIQAGLAQILTSLPSSTVDHTKLLTSYFMMGGDPKNIPEFLQDNELVIAQTGLEDMAIRKKEVTPSVTSGTARSYDQIFEEQKKLSTGANTIVRTAEFEGGERNIPSIKLQQSGLFIAAKILGIPENEFSNATGNFGYVVKAYQGEMKKIEGFEKSGANQDQIKQTKASLSSAFLVFAESRDLSSSDTHHSILIDSAKKHCEGKSMVLGALRLDANTVALPDKRR